MHVQFVDRPKGGPERLICDAALVFDEPGPLYNIKFIGFSLWRDQDGDIYVTLPARTYGAGPERRFFELLRSVTGNLSDVKNLKSWVIAEYHRSGGPQPTDDEPAVFAPASGDSPENWR